MLPALLAGVLAGLGIAVPVGAIAVLILDLGARRGFGAAFAAGSGAASADLLYATLAVFAGAPIAAALEPARTPLRIVSAGVLLAIALQGLRRALGARAVSAPPPARALPAHHVYAGFLGLTLLNPMTVTYFAALVLGLPGERLADGGLRAVFVLGAFAASWSWQTLLAASGAVLHTRITPHGRLLTAIAGSVVVAGLALRILLTV